MTTRGPAPATTVVDLDAVVFGVAIVDPVHQFGMAVCTDGRNRQTREVPSIALPARRHSPVNIPASPTLRVCSRRLLRAKLLMADCG